MPHMRNTGGIFWRQDSSGNLTAYDVNGNILAKTTGGQFGFKLSSNANAFIPAANTSNVFVSTGGGTNLNPIVSTRILAIFAFSASINSATSVGKFRIYRNTTGIPAQGVSVGSDVNIGAAGGNEQDIGGAVSGAVFPVTLVTLDTGLTPGTTYFYYLAYANSGVSLTLTVNTTVQCYVLEA